ncbi:voltage-dependent calcium channel subunit alpha-2/delta-3-like [Ostrinia nubilalis]|uniref:voltage-dependent calcium channel subunit alpha-2/delta-3-like n=1 Tax=Ostrinia nubilalis TaxID=29057 RepID=UPI00308265FB
MWDLPEHCRSLRKLHLRRSEHFDADVSLDHSSVHAAAEVFDCSQQLDKKLEAVSKWDLTEHCRSLRKLHLRRSEHFDADVSLDHSSVHAAAELDKKLEAVSKWDLTEHCRSLRKLHLRRSEHFDADVSLDHSSVHAAAELDKKLETESKRDLPEHCRSLRKLHLRRSEHFDADVSLDHSSVHAAAEVFDCNPIIKNHLYWSEGLLSTFKDNYAQDASMDFQYFCSARGFLRHYPAALWSSLFQLPLETDNVYDCRLRPWYVSANGAPRDILILLDASGSMDNSSNQVTAEWFTQTLLNALPDDDQVNVLRFNVIVKSPISCFDDKLVPADHVNTAAMMSELKELPFKNETKMDYVLRYAIRLLQRQKPTVDRPVSCQQAIVVVTDSLYHNYTELLRELDPTGRIRLFVMWLHDQYGLRDNTREYSNYISCDRDGYFAELLSSNDVTEQVMNIMRVLERPLVAQRKERLQVYSDVYAHVEVSKPNSNYISCDHD